jgi:hypothetical protein
MTHEKGAEHFHHHELVAMAITRRETNSKARARKKFCADTQVRQ